MKYIDIIQEILFVLVFSILVESPIQGELLFSILTVLISFKLAYHLVVAALRGNLLVHSVKEEHILILGQVLIILSTPLEIIPFDHLVFSL